MESPFTCKEMCPYEKGTYLDFCESLYLFDEVFRFALNDLNVFSGVLSLETLVVVLDAFFSIDFELIFVSVLS